MNFKSVLLGFLAIRDMSGYELKAIMDNSVGFFFGSTYGSIYPALQELEAGGLVEKTTVVQQERPNKNIYHITSAGKSYFLTQMETPPALDTYRSEFLIRLFFGKHQRPEQLLRWIAQDRAFRQAQLQKLQETEKEIPSHEAFGRMCLEFGLTYFTSTLAWLDKVQEEVNELARRDVNIGNG